METTKKLSIVIPVYNSDEEHLEKCLTKLIEQTYKNIEIFIVNFNTEEKNKRITEKYKDSRIKNITLQGKKGLFQAEIYGAKKATGDYITFLNYRDYPSVDYYRTLMSSATQNDADIAWGNFVLEYESGEKKICNLMDSKRLNLSNEEILKQYFKQEGLSFDWQVTWNKVYKKEVFKKAEKYFDKVNKNITFGDDFLISTLLFSFSKKLVKEDLNDCIFHYVYKNKKNNSKKIEDEIDSLINAFDYVSDFLNNENKFEEYKTNINGWKNLYTKQVKDKINDSKISNNEKNELQKLLEKFQPQYKEVKNTNYFTSIQTNWENSLEKMKTEICKAKTKCVSFDIFDTLILRPFFVPADLFILLNKYFDEYTNNKVGIEFSKIRVFSEQLTRDLLYTDECQEVTLNQIYDTLEKEYGIDRNILDKMKQKEIDYEVRFCTKRKIGYELYTLALDAGKKVIFTSDMYLESDVIRKILEKNGYTEEDKIYLSSEVKVSKSKGKLFDYIIKDIDLKPEEIIHIGDNYCSDYQQAKKKGINALHLPRALDVALNEGKCGCLFMMLYKNMPFWKENAAAVNFLGIRVMMAVVANKYFDNPFRSFNYDTDFNADPYLIGYFALGMYIYGIANWLLTETQNKGYTNIVFMARDGYLPMKAYEILKQYYTNVPKEKYLHVSRKALLPTIPTSRLDFYKVQESVNIINHTPIEVIEYLKPCLKDGDYEKVLEENKIEPNKKIKTEVNYNKFVKVLIDNFYDEDKQSKNLNKLRNYFEKFYIDKSATFDIGYSGRPELLISRLCNKPIDTFFVNINHEEALRHANKAGFKLETFFDGKPSIIGLHFETIISDLAPSCIKYDMSGEEVKPVFEKYNKTYQEEFLIGIMQNAAIEFVQDMSNIFGKELNELYYVNYYVALPIMAYMHSSGKIDRSIFNAIYFEDDVGIKEIRKTTSLWDKELISKNQETMRELLYGKTAEKKEKEKTEYLNYNREPDLEHHSKFARLLYYAVFDRETFGRRMKDIFKHTKILYGIIWFIYFILRTMKRVIYFIIHSITGFNKKQKQKQEQKKKDDEDYENDEDEE